MDKNSIRKEVLRTRNKLSNRIKKIKRQLYMIYFNKQ